MESNQRTAPDFLHKGQGKSTHFQVQMKRVFAAFYGQPKTMLMVEVETGIMRSNITRYVAKWKKQGCIKITNLGICPISKHRAGFYTTNPELFPEIVENINSLPCNCKGEGVCNSFSIQPLTSQPLIPFTHVQNFKTSNTVKP